MAKSRKLIDSASHSGFEFDYARNVIFFQGSVIRLSPHEADILQVLLNNRAHPSPISNLIRRVYGAFEPDSAATSIRVAIHSLRKKIEITGMKIRAEPRVGYEIDAACVPELNRRLSDKVRIALDMARASDEREIAEHLQIAFALAEAKRAKWSAPPVVAAA